eukprot:3483882-Rhodomonas_salina.1
MQYFSTFKRSWLASKGRRAPRTTGRKDKPLFGTGYGTSCWTWKNKSTLGLKAGEQLYPLHWRT